MQKGEFGLKIGKSKEQVSLNQKDKDRDIFANERFTPKKEEIMDSKIVRTTIGFAAGFAAGFITPYFLFDSKTGEMEFVQIPSAIILGALNGIRVAVGDPEKNKEDEHNFFKSAIPATIVATAIFSTPLVGVTVGASIGLTSVFYKRWKNKKENEE